jgi:hypothetical protein
VQAAVLEMQEPNIKTRWRWLANDSALRPSESKFLYSAESADILEPTRDKFNSLVRRRLSLFVEACSIYEECELICMSEIATSCSDALAQLSRASVVPK